MPKIPRYDLDILEGNIEEAGTPDPYSRKGKKAEILTGQFLPRSYFLEKREEALKLGILPPEDDSPMGIMEYETRVSILRELNRKGLLIPNWDI